MKSKLTVKRIVDSFLSKDEVGFYKVEWEESWLPIDAIDHLKNLVEEFWENKEPREAQAQEGGQTVGEGEEDGGEEKDDEKEFETFLQSPHAPCRTDDLDGRSEGMFYSCTKDNVVEKALSHDISPSIENTSISNKGVQGILPVVPCEAQRACCYFCGDSVAAHHLKDHERAHIAHNHAQALMNLTLNQCDNDKHLLVHIQRETDHTEQQTNDNDDSARLTSSSSTTTVLSTNGKEAIVVEHPNTNEPSDSKLDMENTCMTSAGLGKPQSCIPVSRIDNVNVVVAGPLSAPSKGISCPVCGLVFSLFDDFHVHFQSHRNNSNRYINRDRPVENNKNDNKCNTSDARTRCTECGRQFTSIGLFQKHTRLHIDSKRRHKLYGERIKSLKVGRATKGKRYQARQLTEANSDNFFRNNKHLIDLSKKRSSPSDQIQSKVVNDVENDGERKRIRKEETEFSAEVLRSARLYIKSVSKRRKVIKQKRLKTTPPPGPKTLEDGIGVDVELERSENALPNITMIDGRKAYGCKTCGKTFFNKFHHREHYNVHSGEMPYECEFCLKRFAQRSGWNRHIKLHHKYDVFQGPLPRYAGDKPNDASCATTSGVVGPSPSFVARDVSQSSQLQGIVLPSTAVVGPGFINNSSVQPNVVRARTVFLGPRPSNVGHTAALVLPVGAPAQVPIPLNQEIVRSVSAVPVSTVVSKIDNPDSGSMLSSSTESSGSTSEVVSSTFVVTTKEGIRKWYDFIEYKPKPVSTTTPIATTSATTPITIATVPLSKSPVHPSILLSPTSTQPTYTLLPVQPQVQQPQQPTLPPQVQQLANITAPQVMQTIAIPVRPPSFSGASLTQFVAMNQLTAITTTSPTTDGTTAVTSNSTNNTARVSNHEVQAVKKKPPSSSAKKTAFQCKKVRTMSGQLIFMIRVSEKGTDFDNHSSDDNNNSSKEFAYILDDAGYVESRIFVDDYPGGDWLDFPLDETANDVLKTRVHEYDEQNRRGPKPSHLKEVVGKTHPVLRMIHNGKATIKATSLASVAATSTINTIAGQVVLNMPAKSTHGRSFRSGREKKFTCTVCERKFLAQAHLNDHMLIHTGELPYSCMFCNRPFRHKSGLNSHHKRHIQRGVFNRPISSKDKSVDVGQMPATAATHFTSVHPKGDILPSTVVVAGSSTLGSPVSMYQNYVVSTFSFSSAELTPPVFSNAELKNTLVNKITATITKDSSEKTRRKCRNPKQLLKTSESDHEEDLAAELEGNPGGTESQLFVGVDRSDIFACNFCPMKFPMRTAYLKHLSKDHKAHPQQQQMSDAMDLQSCSEASIFSGDDMVKEEPFDDLLDLEEDGGIGDGIGLDEGSVGVDNLFPDVTIKEEEIDHTYLA